MSTIEIIGIDPGVNGGIAWITNGKATAIKMPDSEEEIREVLTELRTITGLDRKVILEKIHASPIMGSSVAFNYGCHFTFLKCECYHLLGGAELVTPQKWQSSLNCLTGGNKNVSKTRAQELFPTMKITLKTADALLLAHYGYMKYGRHRS